MAAYEFNALFLLQVLGWIFLPVYIATGVHTLPEYTKRRFGTERIRIYLSLLSILLYISRISTNLFSGAIFIQQSLKWSLYLSILLLLVITALLTITGGLAAVIYTDTLQAFIMVIGSTILMIISVVKIGGYEGLKEKYPHAISNTTLVNNSTCGLPSERAFQMLRPSDDPNMPWIGFILGATPGSMWFWCSDQMVVQRALAAKSLSHAQGGTLLAGYLKILPMFAMSIPGMISRVLYPDEVACSDPDVCYSICENRHGCSNIAYPRLVLGIMPQGLRGVMMAVMLSGLVSNLTSIFNSASTLFTMDIYRKIRRRPKNNELMIIGRVCVIVMVAIGIALIPLIKEFHGSQLFVYLVTVESHICPQILVIYLLAILWKRTNEKATICGLVLGSLFGLIRLVMVFVYPPPHCGEPDTRPSFISKIHFMYFSIVLTAFTTVVTVGVSLCTKPPAPSLLVHTTYWTCWNKTELPEQKPEVIELQEPMIKTPTSNAEHRNEGADEGCRLGRVCCKATMWICGINEENQVVQEQGKQVNLKTLEQSLRMKRILSTLLGLVLISAASIYIYFSLPTH
ncbi:sodium/glucose cotransporter 4-like isoform X2 [Tubulanus polymorphus]